MVPIFLVTKVFCLGSIYYDQVQSRVYQKVTLDPSVTLINDYKITHIVRHITSRNGQRQAWWPKSAATPFPRKIGSPVKTAFWRLFFTSVCRCFACFILTLRESFNSRFQEGFTIHIKKTRILGIRHPRRPRGR